MIRPVSSPNVSLAGIAKLFNCSISSNLPNASKIIESSNITGVAQSASEVEAGDLFLALPGAKHHGIEFLNEAISRGAVAVLTVKKGENQIQNQI